MPYHRDAGNLKGPCPSHPSAGIGLNDHERVPRGLSRSVSDGALDGPSFLLIANTAIHHQIPSTKGHWHIGRFLAGSTNRLYVT